MTDSGVVVVDKPGGMTSHDVVARLRRVLGIKKVGHAGTLDPMATGVLVVGVGKATRLLGQLIVTEKEYAATIRLGAATSTDDAEGDRLWGENAAGLDENAVRQTLLSFRGALEQVPSSVSAVKLGGRPAHQRVRAGEQVTLPARQVTIHELDVGGLRRSAEMLDVDISLRCSSGTYVRAIARDLGRQLGVGGHLVALRRTRVGPFTLADCPLALGEMTGAERPPLLALGAVARRLFPSLDVEAEVAEAIGYGRRLQLRLPAEFGPVAMLAGDGELLALYQQQGEYAVPLTVLV